MRKINFSCFFLLLFFNSIGELWAQDKLLQRLQEDRYMYCDDLVEVCSVPQEIINLLVTYEIYSGNTKVYITSGYYDLFKSKLKETFDAQKLESLWLEGAFKTLPTEVGKPPKIKAK